MRAIGSGNIGATNVLRTGNRTVAAATMICDALKATVPILLMNWIAGDTAGLIAAAFAFLGHLFPVWLGFKGGKGVGTYIGILLGLAWQVALIFLAVWLIVALVFRRSSLAALTAAALSPFSAWLLDDKVLVLPLLAFAAAIWLTHRANIARLLKGTEPRIELGKRA